MNRTAKMGKMQVLGVVAVVLAVYNVHATVYFREEFLDGGKFALDFFPRQKRKLYRENVNFHSVHVTLNII